jgi:hypothetical protein
MFDRLSGTSPTNRNPSNQIVENVFKRLQEKLSACQGITKYVDKFVAHSATPESRSIQDETISKITFKHLWEAQQILFEVAEFISIVLFSEGHMALAIENPTFFEFWETPLVEKDEIDIIRTTLEDYRKKTEKWNVSGIEDIWRWIGEK